MGADPLVLTVPMPPNLANRPMHHMVKHRVKVGYWALCDLMHGHGYDQKALADLAKLEARTKIPALKSQVANAREFATAWMRDNASLVLNPPIAARWPHASIRSVMHLGAAMDDGNAMNRHKWVEDWLVTRGYLADDRKKCLTWEGLPTQIIKRDGNYRIELVLSPLTTEQAA